MSDTPTPVDRSFEFNALEELVQTALDRFAALSPTTDTAGERSDGTRDMSASDDGQEE